MAYFIEFNELSHPQVGISKIFKEGADGIVKSDTVVVSKAFQEAFVKVDEEGATAGAFTGKSNLNLNIRQSF